MSGQALRLHSYWRSTAAYRVRIALNLKGLDVAQTALDLRTGAQRDDTYLAINPQGLIPALDTGDGHILTQSSAIIEWLDERFPQPPLLPLGANDRAVVRAMAAAVACDIHPLNNLRILSVLRSEFHASDAQISGWIGRWIGEGFAALEAMIVTHGHGYAFGAAPTMADCFLVPQVYSARRFEVDLAAFPRLTAAADLAAQLPAFAAAHPSVQPDADD